MKDEDIYALAAELVSLGEYDEALEWLEKLEQQKEAE